MDWTIESEKMIDLVRIDMRRCSLIFVPGVFLLLEQDGSRLSVLMLLLSIILILHSIDAEYLGKGLTLHALLRLAKNLFVPEWLRDKSNCIVRAGR
jgi:hypothetical protein